METFFYKRALIKVGADEVAKGILLRKTSGERIVWASKDEAASWKPNGGFFTDFPIQPSDLFTWNFGEADSIDEMVSNWNSYIRHSGTVAEKIAFSKIWIEAGDEKRWNGSEWNITFDDVEWVLPQVKDEFVVDGYEEEEIYTGQGSYHSHHGVHLNRPTGEFKGHRIGVELEVECRSQSDLDKISALRSNWFYQERDGSLGSYGDEIITIPLLPKDAKSVEFWKPLITKLNKHADSWRKSSCGLHVHIGKESLGRDATVQSETLGKLLYFYHHLIGENESARLLNEKIYGRAHTYSEHDGKSEIGKAVGVIGKEVLKDKDICKKVADGMVRASSSGRYFDINLENSATIEFRKGKGSISAERITAVVAWSEGMIDYCRKTSWTALDFKDFVDWIRERRGTPVSLKGFLAIDA